MIRFFLKKYGGYLMIKKLSSKKFLGIAVFILLISTVVYASFLSRALEDVDECISKCDIVGDQKALFESCMQGCLYSKGWEHT
jgi:hypothetical protein